jgi:hypothetical protein
VSMNRRQRSARSSSAPHPAPRRHRRHRLTRASRRSPRPGWITRVTTPRGWRQQILCRRVFLSVTDWCPRRGGRCGPRMAAGQLEAGPAESTNEFHPRGSSKCS